ncbi:MAG: hypothetical protein HUJ25_05525 [Crocinitomicaceae bacterium]|nr:hypothetical protein [Crocinitomicaceae bacterium]
MKQKFLAEIPHPKLIDKQINRLTAYSSLQTKQHIDIVLPDRKEELATYLQHYIDLLMPLKLKIANSRSAKPLLISLQELKELQLAMISKLESYYPKDKAPKVTTIKQSDPFLVYDYLKEIQTQQLQENQIKSYLCRQFEKQDENIYSPLLKGVLRANLIVQHDR